jgi:glutathione S-transferase
MRVRGDSEWIAGDKPTLADLYLAPACFYVSLVDDAPKVFDAQGFQQWWDRMQQLESYRTTEPDLG